MGKTHFLAQLDADRLGLLAAIGGLSAQEMTVSLAIGEWTVKDVLTQTALPHNHPRRRRA